MMNSWLASLPVDIIFKVLIYLPEDDLDRLESADLNLFGLDRNDFHALRSSRSFQHQKYFMIRADAVSKCFTDGLFARISKYNELVTRRIIYSPHRYLKPSGNEMELLHPTDEPSIRFWSRVQEMEMFLMRHRMARFVQDRQKQQYKRRCADGQVYPISSAIAGLHFHMEFRLAHALIERNLHFSPARRFIQHRSNRISELLEFWENNQSQKEIS